MNWTQSLKLMRLGYTVIGDSPEIYLTHQAEYFMNKGILSVWSTVDFQPIAVLAGPSFETLRNQSTYRPINHP